MNNHICNSCGGPFRTIDLSCRYCGGSLDSGRKLSDEDKRRLMAFAVVMDKNLWRNTFKYKLYLNYTITSVNIGMIFLVIMLYLKLNGSIIISLVMMFLMGGLMAAAYFSLFWFSIFYTPLMKKVYDDRIKPVIEHFLASYNYSGSDLEKIIKEMKLEMREVLPKSSAVKDGDVKIDSFISFLNCKIGDRIFIRESRLTISITLVTAYLLLMSSILYQFFLPFKLVPLLWVVPGFLYLTLDLMEKVPSLIKTLQYHVVSGPDRKFAGNVLLPLIAEYCSFTGIEHSEIISRLYSLYQPVLRDLLKEESYRHISPGKI